MGICPKNINSNPRGWGREEVVFISEDEANEYAKELHTQLMNDENLMDQVYEVWVQDED